MADFVIPDFLAAYSEEDLYRRMRAMLPADIDSSEGSHVWNFLRPTASVAAELCQFTLPQVIMTIFPEWSAGEYLDAHAKTRGLSRRAAEAAAGALTITGTAGAVVPADSRFTTASAEDRPAAEYATTEDAVIGTGGTVSVPVVCTETGAAGNTAAGTVVLVSGSLPQITGVINPEAITGGLEEESDDSLRERIMDYDQSLDASFVGSYADYKRWAGAVSGVGSVTVIDANDGRGTVTILVTDSEGAPADEELCRAVEYAILRPDAPEERLAPVNARLDVRAPDPVSLAVRATVELAPDSTLVGVRESFRQGLAAYLPGASEEGVIKYSRVAAILSATVGVTDYAGLATGKDGETLGTGNIVLEASELPTVEAEALELTEGTV